MFEIIPVCSNRKQACVDLRLPDTGSEKKIKQTITNKQKKPRTKKHLEFNWVNNELQFLFPSFVFPNPYAMWYIFGNACWDNFLMEGWGRIWESCWDMLG